MTKAIAQSKFTYHIVNIKVYREFSISWYNIIYISHS